MNPNDVDIEAATQAQNELAQKQYQARLDALCAKARQSAANKASAARGIVTHQINGEHPAQPEHRPKSQNWSFRIEGFRSEDGKAEIYIALVEASGESLIDASANAVSKLKKGEAQFNRSGT